MEHLQATSDLKEQQMQTLKQQGNVCDMKASLQQKSKVYLLMTAWILLYD
jgi:hypothetical protein